ncbi:MAG: L,D-transpeptidase [Acidimicrobiia bacterium]
MAVVALGACGGTHAADRKNETSPTTAVSARSAPDTTTTTTLPAYESVTAQAIVPRLSVFNRPNTRTPARVLDNPWLVDPSQPATAVPQVFLVETRRRDGWVRILLPIRPNGTSGWVRAADVTLSPVTFKLRVQLAAHRLTVFDRGIVVYSGPVADGAPSTPTPVGQYYIRVLIKAPDPNTVYGPYAYGLSSHSDTLTSFDGGDAEIGIHGNDDASVLGESVTHGCIRIDNAEITRLAGILPLGTPVDIEP